MRLANKIALVTGGAQGLGFAIAKTFAEHGAKVVITDLQVELGDAAAATINQQFNDRCRFIQQDVTNEERWQQVVEETLGSFGKLDILVNNAGIALTASIEDETLEGWRTTQAVNLDAVFMGTQMAVRAMKKNGGSIINISSIEGMVGDPKIPAYNASKGGIRLLTKSAALYCAQEGYAVRVNSVHPGFIRTEMVEKGLDSVGPEAWDMVQQAIPAGKLGIPEDVAYGALYLASDESTYVNGSELVIDGGFLAR
ncbi:MAG: glucose 1-dehydrogenase [Gammaproteobacteria bacterium]|nr:glucose 1-dehydrogenase [Gammaproteobacteria bacterium]NND38970.1 glucose 1-dehydrogenase [Pseudomonadales bacterium]MBT8151912.1 glucose 1-dehydrogenase [Gammaproteobacteria bacterium]NNL11532.1 glucose 1-dehydrogenase [Pseudomonadales bacterium]NNM10966.1 glucose 1-dehydrogenase [Pseudomonadales bacterium]